MKTKVEETLEKIPFLTIHAGPKDPQWADRLKE